MKKVLSVILVMIGVVGCFAGCQKEADGQTIAPTTLVRPTTIAPSVGTTLPTTASGSIPNTTVPSLTSSVSATTTFSTRPSSQSTTKPTSLPTTPTTVSGLKLPYTIPGTGLILERVEAYSGIYVEDGSNADIQGVAMILLHNRGKSDIDLATIQLTYGEFTREFVVTSLPKGMSAVIQEKNKKAMAAGILTECTATVIESNKETQLSYTQISVVENTDNSLTIKNLTNRDIPSARIFYKYFMNDQQLLVGGVTFTVNVIDLKAGQTVTVKPSHYLVGASQIVMVQTYEVQA